jgi:hypothetical protein
MLHNAVNPEADGITAPMLKAGLELATWLHKVILAIWRSGRAFEA